MPWPLEILSEIRTDKTISLVGQVFDHTDIEPLIEALKDNKELTFLDLSATNFQDKWFNLFANELLKKDDAWLKKLTINFDNTLISDESLPLLKKLKSKLNKLQFKRSEFLSSESIAELGKEESNSVAKQPAESKFFSASVSSAATTPAPSGESATVSQACKVLMHAIQGVLREIPTPEERRQLKEKLITDLRSAPIPTEKSQHTLRT